MVFGKWNGCMEKQEGRYIGDVHDKSAPTEGRDRLLYCKDWEEVGPIGCQGVYAGSGKA